MDPISTREQIISVFKEVFKKTEVFTEKTSANDIREWDSLNHMVLINKLEKKFGIRFNLFRLIELRTLGDFVRYISNESENGNQGN